MSAENQKSRPGEERPFWSAAWVDGLVVFVDQVASDGDDDGDDDGSGEWMRQDS